MTRELPSNQSTTDWLVTSGLNSDPFLNGPPNLIFDFPDLAPGATATVPFDHLAPAGLYELTWDSTAPVGFANSGTFTLSAEWWSGDPLHGGSFLSDAADTTANYSATVTSAVPEPATLALLASGLCAIGAARRRK